ncbi:MAG: Gfo/Idh/MocA family oxidoreductase [Synergistaceae bacterium]|jgi:predicted dehydrogenase|nr:Gfo/Idh/MocA family oxidoreductase [Synergistaceae bacterium]
MKREKNFGISGERLKYGLVGGGPGSFIAAVHRTGIDFTRAADLVAGCFSRDSVKNRTAALEFGISNDRTYSTFDEMAKREAARDDGIDFAVIATPNNTHYAASRAFLENDINVSCDKPLCFTVEEALELASLARDKGLLFMVTYAYTGYPLIHHARELVRSGQLGAIRVVMCEYPQGWLSDRTEDSGNLQAKWREDPAQAGIAGCVGDIGTHVENLAHTVTGLEIESLSATLATFVEGRTLEDNAMITVRYKGGAVGHYWPSQVAIGHENSLAIRVYGSEASIEWEQEKPNVMRMMKKGQPPMILTRGGPGLGRAAARWTRIHAGHPEGAFEAWANIYEAFCNSLKRHIKGQPSDDLEYFPTVIDGMRGVKFIHDCVKSSKADSAWVNGASQYCV